MFDCKCMVTYHIDHAPFPCKSVVNYICLDGIPLSKVKSAMSTNQSAVRIMLFLVVPPVFVTLGCSILHMLFIISLTFIPPISWASVSTPPAPSSILMVIIVFRRVVRDMTPPILSTVPLGDRRMFC